MADIDHRILLKYLESPDFCPKCQSKNIDGENDLEVEYNKVIQTIVCADCNFSWYDRYVLEGIEEVEHNNITHIGGNKSNY